jgi:hypothetical protein
VSGKCAFKKEAANGLNAANLSRNLCVCRTETGFSSFSEQSMRSEVASQRFCGLLKNRISGLAAKKIIRVPSRRSQPTERLDNGRSQLLHKMNLPSGFDESAGRVQVLADGIVFHGLDHDEIHAFPTKIVKSMLNQLATNSLPSCGSIHGQIRNPPFPGFTVNPRRDVSDYPAFDLRDKDSVWIDLNILIHMPSLAPSPVMIAHYSDGLFHILIDRNSIKPLNGNASEFIEIPWLVSSHAHRQSFPD